MRCQAVSQSLAANIRLSFARKALCALSARKPEYEEASVKALARFNRPPPVPGSVASCLALAFACFSELPGHHPDFSFLWALHTMEPLFWLNLA